MTKEDLKTSGIPTVTLPLVELAGQVLNETDCFFCGTPLQQRPIQYEVMGESVLVVAELPGFYCEGCDEDYFHSEILANFYLAASESLKEIMDKEAKRVRRAADLRLARIAANP